MLVFFAFVKKEFYHVFRDKKSLLTLLGLPIVQIILYGFALTNEIKNTPVAIVDLSNDNLSRQIIYKINSSSYFSVNEVYNNPISIEREIQKDKVKMVVVIQSESDKTLLHSNNVNIQLAVDGSDPNNANVIISYMNFLLNDYQLSNFSVSATGSMQIIPEVRMLYNPELKGAPNFIPGVMALVLMLVCVMMTSVSIVKEKEMGTMEILLVSPFNPLLVIVSKALPYLILSIVNLIIILFLSDYMLDMPCKGSLALLFTESILLIITALSLGLLISTLTNSQETAMLISMMAMLLPTMMLSGFMFPIENMPKPLQIASNIVPAKWYYIIVKDIMIKGLDFKAVIKETIILFCMTVFFLILSIRKFKTRL